MTFSCLRMVDHISVSKSIVSRIIKASIIGIGYLF
ncbi:Uncharacterised protein [Klebsiella pneumoniae]|nr:Uncharacterised protein [Klebsiella pneumoniae]SVJ78846.1 Uncharacterised protein [Klebsiella pneumoniae]SVP10429.1 Uncharacterised protein [Klebsiella pneumoniae]SWC83210.1 Uncharacterised protein [Klebsiella pneumoniae]SWK87269.1 Uncharacterised protein [Klebsiella pneumoniae]